MAVEGVQSVTPKKFQRLGRLPQSEIADGRDPSRRFRGAAARRRSELPGAAAGSRSRWEAGDERTQPAHCGDLRRPARAPRRPRRSPTRSSSVTARSRQRLLARIGLDEIDGERPLDAARHARRRRSGDCADRCVRGRVSRARLEHRAAFRRRVDPTDRGSRRAGRSDAAARLRAAAGAGGDDDARVHDRRRSTGAPKAATIPKGTKVASVPLPGREAADLRDRRRARRARRMERAPAGAAEDRAAGHRRRRPSITIAGVSTTAKVGDLLIVYLAAPGDERLGCGDGSRSITRPANARSAARR